MFRLNFALTAALSCLCRSFLLPDFSLRQSSVMISSPPSSQELTRRSPFVLALSSPRFSPWSLPGLFFPSCFSWKPFFRFRLTFLRALRPALPFQDPRSFFQDVSLLPHPARHLPGLPTGLAAFPFGLFTPSRSLETSSDDLAFLPAFAFRTHRAFRT